MADGCKLLTLKKSETHGFGFSILGGAGTQIPPFIYDIIEGSPAASCSMVSTGDVILEVNGIDVQSFTTKEVLNTLRKTQEEVLLKLKSDSNLRAKVQSLQESPDDVAALRSAISHNDLDGVQQILAKKKDEPKVTNNVNNNRTKGHKSEKCVESCEKYVKSNNIEKCALLTNNCSHTNFYGHNGVSEPTSPYEHENPSLSYTTFTYPSSVRISRSEDHLQECDSELDDDINTSLNTLLDTSDNARTHWSYTAPLSSPESLHSSHDSDSPLIKSHSRSQSPEPQSPTSSMQFSAAYDKITNNSASSEASSPDTDIPDELDWDEDSYMPNGLTDKTFCRLDENKIVLRVAGPDKFGKQFDPSKPLKTPDPEKTPTNSPASTPVSENYQHLCESEDETISEREPMRKNDNSQTVGVISPPPSEDESDIESLHSFHFSPKAVDLPSAVRLAKRLYALDGFKKSDVSRHLSKNNEFNKVVAEEYLRHFDFKKDTLDGALRKFLDRFCLAGETQERERVLVHFSKRYLDCNPNTFNSQDAVHTLTCAIMLLNTDLHSANIGRKMTANEFIENLADLNDGENFAKETLKSIYESIKGEPLKWAMDEDTDIVNAKRTITDNCIGGNPFLTPPSNTGTVYKKGYVMRKCCFEPHRKKTPFGKRSWKMCFCVIRDLVLFLYKDEQGARDPNPADHQTTQVIRLHHAIALRAQDYAKKEHVFRLNTADQAEYLLQTSDSKELQAWMDAINFVAASLSAPPMAGAVGSQKKFQRPLLPCSVTKLNLVDQLEDHQSRLDFLEKDLEKHRALPEKNKSSNLSNYKEKEAFLLSEVKRYQTYVYLLRSRLDSSPAAPTSIEMTELPVFKEDGRNAITPSTIPPRRPCESDEDNSDGKCKLKTTDSITEVKTDKQKNAKRRFSLRPTNDQDDFQKEMRKILKEKAKREKRDRKMLEKEKEKNKEENEKEEVEDDPRIGTFDRMAALFRFKKLNKESANAKAQDAEVSISDSNESEKMKKSSTSDNGFDCQQTTLNEDVNGFYKEEDSFKKGKKIHDQEKINVSNSGENNSTLQSNETDKLKEENKDNYNGKPDKNLDALLSQREELPLVMKEERHLKEELHRNNVLPPKSEPPPLPPKPKPGSAIHKNIGTKLDI